jgi:hypothetical protein
MKRLMLAMLVATLLVFSGINQGCDCERRWTVTTAVDGQGTVDPQGTKTYDDGELVTVTATPAASWRFSSWSGDYSGAESSFSFGIEKSVSFVAHFIPISTASTINFDSLTVPESGAAAIPKDQFKQLGVIFTPVSADSSQRNDTFSVVRHLLTGNGAHSQPYAASYGWSGWKLEASFVDSNTGADAVTNFVSAYVGDKSGEPDAITMTAYDMNGNVIASASYTSQPQSRLDDATDFGVVEIAREGIHRVVFTDDSSSGADMDDFAFNPPTI